MSMSEQQLPGVTAGKAAEVRPERKPEKEPPHVRALSDIAFHRFQRLVWAVCIVVYLTVFIGGIQAGGSELLAVGRAVGFTLVAALLGRTALGLLSRASVPVEPVPMDEKAGRVGSLADLLGSANVATQADEEHHEDAAAAA
jgi:hypothetical protein